MIEWSDEAVVLGTRSLGENKQIVSVLTKDHGRASGVMRISKKAQAQGICQPGSRVEVTWKARLEEHLGYLSLELNQSLVGVLMAHPQRLLALSAAACLTHEAFPERHPYPGLYTAWGTFLQGIQSETWAEAYVYFECVVLEEMGFSLKLESCCVSGEVENLVYVSPKTGRAVSADAGRAYHDKLLALPAFLRTSGERAENSAEIKKGLLLTDYFLQQHLSERSYKKLSSMREQLKF